MAKFLNTLPEGDLTFSSYDPNSPPFALRASSTIQNILNAVEVERQRRHDKAIIDAILRSRGIEIPGTPPILPPGGGTPLPKYPGGTPPTFPESSSMIRQIVTGPGGRPIIGMAQGPTPIAIDSNAPPVESPKQSFLGKILSGVGTVLDPNRPPSSVTDIEKGLAEAVLRSQARTYQNLNKPPSDFQLWQQAQKEVLAEAGGSGLVGVADQKEREQLRKKTVERFYELKNQFSPTAIRNKSPEEQTPTAVKTPKASKPSIKGALYKEGQEAFNPKTGERIKLINGKWVPMR